MDGKRIFQERTNIINWADTVGQASAISPSKPHSKRRYTLLSIYPPGTRPKSRPVPRTHTLRKMSTDPTSMPVIQASKVMDALNSLHDGRTTNPPIPEVVQPCTPIQTAPACEPQQPPRGKNSRELRKDYPKEATVEELQKRALKRALSILDTRIADSKERVVELRGLLAERDIEPELFRSMQRQRWMEEKRQIATSHLSKIVEQHLVCSPVTPTTTEEGREKLDSVSRSTTNLVRFFESPGRRVPTRRSRLRRPAHVGSQPRQKKMTAVPTIHHHKGVIPLVLKPSPHVPPFLKNRVKAKQGVNSTAKSQPTSQPSPVHSETPSTTLVQLPSISEVLEPTRNLQAHISGDSNDANGSAIIWMDSPRTKEEILSDLVVNMPDYVDELLAEFDAHSFAPTTALNTSRGPNASQSPSPNTPMVVPEIPKPQRTLASPLHIHKSPSRKRISALFSLADAITPRKVALVNAVSNGRARPLSTATPPTLASPSAIPEEEPTRPFSVSFSALPSSESGGSHEQETEVNNNKRASRLGHRLSFFKRRD